MYALKTLVALLAFSLVSVSAAPAHGRRMHTRHRRSTCRARTSSSTALASSTDASSVATSTAVSTTSVAPVSSSTKVATTSVDESSSTEVSSAATSTHTSTHSSSSSHHSTSTSSAAATATSSTSSGGVTSALKKLFPVSDSESWTTSTAAKNALPLDDSTFSVTKLMKSLTHTYMTAPDGVDSMQAHYPKGSYIPSASPAGGFSFYALGPDDFDLDSAKEVTLSYSVYFDEDFDFNKGGKLPGICEYLSCGCNVRGLRSSGWEAASVPTTRTACAHLPPIPNVVNLR